MPRSVNQAGLDLIKSFEGLKRCSRCKIEKPLEAFHKNKNYAYGRHVRCAQCVAEHRKLNPEVYRKYKRDTWLKNRYKIDQELYDLISLEVGHKCQICQAAAPSEGRKKNLAVDHDHSTGRIRGLLCDSCNRAIGMLKDSPGLLESAIRYLQRNGK